MAISTIRRCQLDRKSRRGTRQLPYALSGGVRAFWHVLSKPVGLWGASFEDLLRAPVKTKAALKGRKEDLGQGPSDEQR